MGISFNSGGKPIAVTDTVTVIDPTEEIRFTSIGSVTDLGSGIAQVTNTGGLSIGDPIALATNGSVLFVGAGTLLAEDNPDFFYNEAQGFLGLGIGAPTRRLDIGGGVGTNQIALTSGADPTRFITISAGLSQTVLTTNDYILRSGCSTEIQIGGSTANCQFTIADAQALNQKIINIDAQSAGGLWGKGAGYADTIANAQANSLFIEGFFAVGTPTPAANTKVNIVGTNSAATDYCLQADSSLVNLLSLRNDGEVSLGRAAGRNGITNIFVGDRSGGNIVVGGAAINNTGVGNSAIREISTGVQNTGIGFNALIATNIGRGNTAVGHLAGNAITSGRNNICIGNSANTTSQIGQRNIMIGNTIDPSTPLVNDELNIGDIIKGNVGATKEVELSCQGAAPVMAQSNSSVIFYEDAGSFKVDYINAIGGLTTFTLA
jgi:hypothetical protein